MAKRAKSGTSDEDTQSVWRSEPAAVYGLEHPVTCPTCRSEIDQLFAVRLFRARVNFVSSLPRSGRVLVCPSCRTILPGELGAVL
jgi:hypothetical protein